MITFQSRIDFENIREIGFYSQNRSGTAHLDYVIFVIDSGYLVQLQDISEYKYEEEQKQRTLEEYQSILEELNVSNEELESTTEELQVANEEMQHQGDKLLQYNQTLQESKAKLEAVFESMTDAVFVSDIEGNFIDFNEAFVTYHRFKNKKECYRTLSEYPDYIDVYFADETLAPLDMWAVPRALRGETVHNAEYMLRRKDTGETWWGSYSFGPIRDNNGEIVGSVVMGREITEQKKAEEELRKSLERNKMLVNLLEISEQPFGIGYPDGRLGYVNKAFERLVRYNKAELERADWSEMLTPKE